MGGKFLILCVLLVGFHLGYCYPNRKSAKSCPPLKLKNGKVKTRPRTFAQFFCNRGYILAGEKYSKCIQGQWDNSPPICVRPDCKKYQQLKNGLIHTTYKGSVLNFFCAPNYRLEGPRYAYCDDMQWNTHMPSCLPTDTTPSLSCDFETEDICGWSHDLNHNFDWTRMNKGTPSGHVGTGPSDDHTKGPGGNGYYMYIEATTSNAYDIARLISPVYKKSSNNTCLEFYYHMYGSGIGELRVYVKKINDTWTLKKEDAVFLREGNQGNEWYRGFVELGTIDQQFQVVFEGVRGISFISDIAIDDVNFIENCVIDISTTEQEMDMSTFSYDSCSNRCNASSTSDMSCNCEEDCYEKNTCCPDYIAVCLLTGDDNTTVEYTTEEDIQTTPETNEIATTKIAMVQPIATTIKVIETTSSTKIIPQFTVAQTPSPRVTKLSPSSQYPFRKMESITTYYAARTTVKPQVYRFNTIKPYVIPPRWKWKTTSKPLVLIPTNTTYKWRIGTLLPVPSFVTITPMPTTKQTTSSIPSRGTTARYPLLHDMLTVPNQATSDGVYIFTEKTNIATKEYPENKDPNHTLLSEKVAPMQEKPRPTNTITVIAVLTVCFIIIGVLGLVFLVKRYTSRNCMRVRRMRHGNGDSQSDVRFLTSDEILDFTIAKPSTVY